MKKREFVVGPIKSSEHYRAAEELQRVVWDTDAIDVIPAHLLRALQRHGGLVFGAYDTVGRLIGCLFGFPSRTLPDNPFAVDPGWHLYSHLMGVAIDWQGRGVGYQLKKAQREWALDQGFDLVTWTFDPLEAANGMLNLRKLGAISRCYLRDFYGEMSEGLNVGLPTDRLEVTWWVRSERVQERLEAGGRRPGLQELLDQGALILNAGRARGDGFAEPNIVQCPEGERLFVEIPARIQAIKDVSMELARAWRLNVREACEAAFAAGYTACDAVRAEVDGVSRVYYFMTLDV